jgi:hypothetical protein
MISQKGNFSTAYDHIRHADGSRTFHASSPRSLNVSIIA